MEESLNILILSCGTRNKIVQYLKKELGDRGQVMVTDSSELAPALYDADKHFIVPEINDKNYLEVILNICKENNIKGVLSLIDPELSILAENSQSFIEIGTTPLVSNIDMLEISFDKMKFNKYLKQYGFKSIKSYSNKEDFYQDIENRIINYPVFIKPVRGSASINISKVFTKKEVDYLFNKFDDLMIQEFMNGIEYGVDAYIDTMSGETTAIFIKEKIKMRAGETDKSVSIHDDKLLELIKEFINITRFEGVIDIDIFKVEGEYYISEVNPRFGGGYPHAYECGVNIPRMIINNIRGKINVSSIGHYESDVCMMKFNEVKIKKIINNERLKMNVLV